MIRNTRLSACWVLWMVACGGASPAAQTSASTASSNPAENEFQTRKSSTAGSAHGATESKIKATTTEAAMKFFVIDKATNEAIPGIVVSLLAPNGKKYYTGETDSLGYGEVLVPVGQAYELVYLSLGQKDIAAKVTVTDEAYQNIKLTLRFKRRVVKEPAMASTGSEPEEAPVDSQPAFRLEGVNFGSGSSKLRPESFARLDSVVEYLTYKASARIEVSGHTDNVGAAATNKALSQKRAQACRAYLVEKGIDGSRIEAVGYGDERPVAANDSEEGRQKNRRIEAKEL